MAVDFNSEHKEEVVQYFPEGVHKAHIVDVELGKNDNDKDFIEFTVEGENSEVGNARMWLTTDAAIKYTFSTIRTIFVHNAKEAKKEEAREMVNKVKDSEELLKLCQDALIGKECWYMVEKSDYTYTNAAGEEKHGYNRNIYGYEPTPKKKTAVEEVFPEGETMDESEVPDGL